MSATTDFVCTIRPDLRGPDPDDALRRDVLDDLGRMRRKLAGMVYRTKAAGRPAPRKQAFPRHWDIPWNDPDYKVEKLPNGNIHVRKIRP